MTEIFESYSDFLKREDKTINGVSKGFSEENKSWENQNKSNKGCWNCHACRDCYACRDCRYIGENFKYACFTGVYRYTCSPRIDTDGIKWVQMGCYLRTLEKWQKDFWNNDDEFPENSKQGVQRVHAFSLALLWFEQQEVENDAS